MTTHIAGRSQLTVPGDHSLSTSDGSRAAQDVELLVDLLTHSKVPLSVALSPELAESLANETLPTATLLATLIVLSQQLEEKFFRCRIDRLIRSQREQPASTSDLSPNSTPVTQHYKRRSLRSRRFVLCGSPMTPSPRLRSPRRVSTF